MSVMGIDIGIYKGVTFNIECSFVCPLYFNLCLISATVDRSKCFFSVIIGFVQLIRTVLLARNISCFQSFMEFDGIVSKIEADFVCVYRAQAP